MDDGAVAQFTAITGTSADTAAQFLGLADGDIQTAMELFFTAGGDEALPPSQPSHDPSIPPPQHPSVGYREDEGGLIHLDSDGEEVPSDGDVDPRERGSGRTAPNSRSAARTPTTSTHRMAQAAVVDDDEAMARRLQEEIYGGAGASSGVDMEGIRAPMGRRTETLIGPESFNPEDPDEMQAALYHQMQARRQPRSRGDRAGIFNQQGSPSIWNEADVADDEVRRDRLSRATAGASEASSKSNMLAEMYRPPFEIMSRMSWDEARETGKEQEKWILVNIQDPSIFDCQVLNRDIWKNQSIKDTVKENFIFMQYSKDDPRGNQYVQYYFQARESQDAYPHIAIVDPRTGEQVKIWSGPPVPKAPEFLMQLHEFLDRYSLNVAAKNPVAKRKPEAKKEKTVDKMTEEEMLEMALQNSLEGSNGGPRDHDPDDLTRSVGDVSKGKGRAQEEDTEMIEDEPTDTNGHSATSPWSSISSSIPHTEPAADAASTRIQFRHPNGRVVRRFALSDPVRRIYEWLKASPLEGKEGTEFELVSMGKNLMDSLEQSIERAGLKNGTVMVEYVEGES